MIGPVSDILDRMPDAWKTSITVSRNTGLDDDGEPRSDAETFEVDGCMLGPKVSEDPLDRGQVVSGDAVLFVPLGTVIYGTDRVVTPEGSAMPGTWGVDGTPVNWPYGVSLNLTKD